MKEFTGRLAWVAGPTAGVVGLAAAAVIGLPTVAEAQPVCMGAMMHVSHGAAGAFSLAGARHHRSRHHHHHARHHRHAGRMGVSTITCIYSFTGSEQTFVVPGSVGLINVVAIGAAGGNGSTPVSGGTGGTGGQGEMVSASVQVNPRSTLYVEVGGAGGNGTTIAAGAA